MLPNTGAPAWHQLNSRGIYLKRLQTRKDQHVIIRRRSMTILGMGKTRSMKPNSAGVGIIFVSHVYLLKNSVFGSVNHGSCFGQLAFNHKRERVPANRNH